MKDRSAEVLPPPLLEAIAKGATVRAFPKNAIIVNEGDETDSVYVILSGRARVYVSNAQGREVQLNVIGPGEYFGEVTLDGGPRSASVMSLDDCRCALSPRTCAASPCWTSTGASRGCSSISPRAATGAW